MTSHVFLAIFDLPTYLVLLYNIPFLGGYLSWTPLPTLILDVINERSLILLNHATNRVGAKVYQVKHTSTTYQISQGFTYYIWLWSEQIRKL